MDILLMAKATTGKTTQKTKKRKQADSEMIIVDDHEGLIFESEQLLVEYFKKQITHLEAFYSENRKESDLSDDEQADLMDLLQPTLDEADQIWRDSETFKEFPIFNFIKNFDTDNGVIHYVAVCYVSTEEEEPTFVFHHFPTQDPELLRHYFKGDLVYDLVFESVKDGAIEGDALGEGDPLAIGMYAAMKVLRSEKDFLETDFLSFAELRDETIQDPDEIWKKTDLDGNVLVFFIKEYPDHEKAPIWYIVSTIEEEDGSSHSLLFSFPTNDDSLVDRYRQGENLQAEEVSQESSH